MTDLQITINKNPIIFGVALFIAISSLLAFQYYPYWTNGEPLTSESYAYIFLTLFFALPAPSFLLALIVRPRNIPSALIMGFLVAYFGYLSVFLLYSLPVIPIPIHAIASFMLLNPVSHFWIEITGAGAALIAYILNPHFSKIRIRR